jgi:hypothetical protein
MSECRGSWTGTAGLSAPRAAWITLTFLLACSATPALSATPERQEAATAAAELYYVYQGTTPTPEQLDAGARAALELLEAGYTAADLNKAVVDVHVTIRGAASGSFERIVPAYVRGTFTPAPPPVEEPPPPPIEEPPPAPFEEPSPAPLEEPPQPPAAELPPAVDSPGPTATEAGERELGRSRRGSGAGVLRGIGVPLMLGSYGLSIGISAIIPAGLGDAPNMAPLFAAIPFAGPYVAYEYQGKVTYSIDAWADLSWIPAVFTGAQVLGFTLTIIGAIVDTAPPRASVAGEERSRGGSTAVWVIPSMSIDGAGVSLGGRF